MTAEATTKKADPIQRALLATGLVFVIVAIVQGLLSFAAPHVFLAVPWIGSIGWCLLASEMVYRWIRRWDARREDGQ